MMRAEGISLRIGERDILHNVDCTVQPGRVTVVMGKNGAGKSTLLKIMAGQTDLGAVAGAVEVDGQTMSTIPPAELAGRRAVLAQSVHLGFPLPVSEVIELGCYHRYHQLTTRQRRDCVNHYLELLELTAFKDRSFTTLSGGEKKRVLLAKCLLQLDDNHVDLREAVTPRYLLLDEPTAALDVEQQYRFVHLATGLARERGMGVLAVLHDLNLAARFADDLVLLRDGQISSAGPTTEVLTKANIRAAFDVDCLIQRHPHFEGPLITTLPYERHSIAPALAP